LAENKDTPILGVSWLGFKKADPDAPLPKALDPKGDIELLTPKVKGWFVGVLPKDDLAGVLKFPKMEEVAFDPELGIESWPERISVARFASAGKFTAEFDLVSPAGVAVLAGPGVTFAAPNGVKPPIGAAGAPAIGANGEGDAAVGTPKLGIFPPNIKGPFGSAGGSRANGLEVEENPVDVAGCAGESTLIATSASAFSPSLPPYFVSIV
jgi:hypothetical protein